LELRLVVSKPISRSIMARTSALTSGVSLTSSPLADLKRAPCRRKSERWQTGAVRASPPRASSGIFLFALNQLREAQPKV
jgi:hypothetical protein